MTPQTPQQTKALQEAKAEETLDRVSKKHGYEDFNGALSKYELAWMDDDTEQKIKSDFKIIINEAMLEYASSQLEAKDKEIELLNGKKEEQEEIINNYRLIMENDYTEIQSLKSQLQQATASSSSSEREDAISQLNQELKETDETLGAKLRNALSPHYGLPSIISKLRERPEILKMVEEQAEQALKNSLRIDTLLNSIDSTLTPPSSKQFSEVDVLRAIGMAREEEYGGGVKYGDDEILKSLTPKEPSEGEGRECPNICHKGMTKPSRYAVCYQCGKPW